MTLPSKIQRLSGWGRLPFMACRTFRPEKHRDLDQFFHTPPERWIARGCGRSYGDAAMRPEGTLLSERLNRFLAFDTTTGLLEAESGVTLADVLEVCLPKGWLPPVMPGTKYVSLGGCFASNIHGKNHLREGDFAEHVRAIRLRLPDGRRLTASASENTDIFRATAGGMGLTGCIESLTLQLKPVTNISLRAEGHHAENLLHMLRLFKESLAEWDYVVGWINHFHTGHPSSHGASPTDLSLSASPTASSPGASPTALGRGYVERARFHPAHEHITPPLTYRPRRPRLTAPFQAPNWLLNRPLMRLYNHRREMRHPDRWQDFDVPFETFFFPLDGLGHWNRLYGRRGFIQYQCALPDHPNIAEHLRNLLEIPHHFNSISFLTVLKYHRDTAFPMGFPMRGYSLAMDFPFHFTRTPQMVDTLDAFVATLGGRVYLAKDTMLLPHNFELMYAHALPAWRQTLAQLDPDHRITSLMDLRIGLKRPLEPPHD